MRPMLSVLLMCFNERDEVVAALKAFQRYRWPCSHEVIVCDNASADGTSQAVSKFAQVRYLRSPVNVGTPVINLGARKARGEFILMLAPDQKMAPGMVAALLDKFRDPKVGFAAPLVLGDDDRRRIDVAGSWLSRSFYAGSVKTDSVPDGTQLPFYGVGIVRARSLLAASPGGVPTIYDEGYFLYGEDVDLGLRLLLSGSKTVFARRAVLYHKGSRSSSLFSRPRLTFLVERNMLTTLLCGMQLRSIALFLPYALAMRGLSIAKDVVRLDFARAFARVRAIGWVALNLGRILERRGRVQAIRRVSDSAFRSVFSEHYFLKVIGNVTARRSW